MHLDDSIVAEACLLKLSIDIGSDYEPVQCEPFDPLEQYREPTMGNGITIEVASMPIESPAKCGIFLKVHRRSHVHKIEA